jgi:hypothetical protein
MDDDTESLFDAAREHAITAESGEALAIVTALQGLATEINHLRTTIEKDAQHD